MRGVHPIRYRLILGAALVAALAGGCRQNPFQTATVSPPPALNAPPNAAALSSLDRNNQDLHRELAQAEQETKLLRDQVQLLQDRLDNATGQLRDAQVARQTAEQRVEAMQASTRSRGATLSANNSIRQSLAVIDIPGVEVRQDDQVIRIELPADQLFEPGGVQWRPTSSDLLDRAARAIQSNYPRQMVGIEGHTDASVYGLPGGAQQLSASQALAVYQYLTTRSRLPSRQLFTQAFGPNQPRVSNATPAGQARNRRIELVVYPQEYQ